MAQDANAIVAPALDAVGQLSDWSDGTAKVSDYFKNTGEIIQKNATLKGAEDINGTNPDITKVSFTINGHRYGRELFSLGDWFNAEAIGWVNEVLEQEGFDGRIHACDDNGQGLILFYGDEAYGETLRRILPGAVWETEW